MCHLTLMKVRSFLMWTCTETDSLLVYILIYAIEIKYKYVCVCVCARAWLFSSTLVSPAARNGSAACHQFIYD